VPQLTPLKADAIKRIQLIYPDGRTVILAREGVREGARDGEEWSLREPFQMPANRFQAETLVSLAQATSTARYPAEKTNLHELKLDKPVLTVRFNDLEVALGDTEPLSGRRYALVGGTVHLINDSVSSLVGAEPTAFVSHALLPAESRPVAIAIPALKQGEGESPAWGGFELRFEDSRWSLRPPDDTVSQDTINTLVDGWRYAHALDVKPYDKERKPLATVRVELQGEAEPIRFDVLSLKPEVVLGRPDVSLQYTLAEPLAKRLFTLMPPEGAGPKGAEG
jgi:hypothetical protein